VNALIEAGRVNATASAFNGARELGINDLAGMCAVVRIPLIVTGDSV